MQIRDIDFSVITGIKGTKGCSSDNKNTGDKKKKKGMTGGHRKE